MKKTTLKMIIVLGMISLTQVAFADWIAQTRNTKICASWRWKARSIVRYICANKDSETQVDRKCNGTAQAYSRVGPLGGSRAEAQAWSSSSGGRRGWAFTNVECLLPGYDPHALFQKNVLNTNDYDQSFAKQYVETDMDFDYESGNNNYTYLVKASYISGYMLLKNTEASDYYSV